MPKYVDALVLEAHSAARLIDPCDRCGSPSPIAALVLFSDYSDFMALCRDCHAELESRKEGDVV